MKIRNNTSASNTMNVDKATMCLEGVPVDLVSHRLLDLFMMNAESIRQPKARYTSHIPQSGSCQETGVAKNAPSSIK